MNNLTDDLACTKCLWTGDSDEYTGSVCPVCKSEIDDINDPPIWEYFDGYNWNKK